MEGKDKVSTRIEVDRQIWAEVKREATLKGETIHQTVERLLKEALKQRRE